MLHNIMTLMFVARDFRTSESSFVPKLLPLFARFPPPLIKVKTDYLSLPELHVMFKSVELSVIR